MAIGLQVNGSDGIFAIYAGEVEGSDLGRISRDSLRFDDEICVYAQTRKFAIDWYLQG
jgi:hypothetical protein